MERNVDYVDEIEDKPIMRRLPDGTRTAFGQDLRRLQQGKKATQLRPLRGFGSGVGELKRGDWRVVLSTIADPRTIWIVCVFKKEAKRGSKMTKKHETLIGSRIARLASILEAPTRHRH